MLSCGYLNFNKHVRYLCKCFIVQQLLNVQQMFTLCFLDFDTFCSSIYYRIDCPLRDVRGVPYLFCSVHTSGEQRLSCVPFAFIHLRLHMTLKIIVRRVEVRRSWWPGSWTARTNPIIRIYVIMNVSLIDWSVVNLRRVADAYKVLLSRERHL
jgi:hypothetical protein